MYYIILNLSIVLELLYNIFTIYYPDKCSVIACLFIRITKIDRFSSHAVNR